MIKILRYLNRKESNRNRGSTGTVSAGWQKDWCRQVQRCALLISIRAQSRRYRNWSIRDFLLGSSCRSRRCREFRVWFSVSRRKIRRSSGYPCEWRRCSEAPSFRAISVWGLGICNKYQSECSIPALSDGRAPVYGTEKWRKNYKYCVDAVFFGGYTVPAYAASKGGVAQLTKALCNEWAGKGIQVNALAPGYMDTEMNTALTDKTNPRYKEITDRIPAHVWGTPEDMKGHAFSWHLQRLIIWTVRSFR